MSELDRAISALLNPHESAEVKAKAFEYINTVKADPGFYTFAMEKSLEIDLEQPQALNYVFFYLQAIQDLVDQGYSGLTVEQRSQMHSYLAAVTRPPAKLIETHTSLMNKLATIYVKVITHDFPQVWPTAFSSLMQAAVTLPTKKFFLTVMKIFNEDFIEQHEDTAQERSRRLRDDIRSQVIGSAALLWKKYLEEENIDVVSATLLVLGDYIDWIPLEVALEFLVFFEKYRTQAQIPVLKCLKSLIRKGMDPNKKLELISGLQLIPFLQSLNISQMNFDLSDEPAAVAELVNAVGLQLIESSGLSLLQPVVDLAVVFLKAEDTTISKAVFDFVTEYVHHLRVKVAMIPPNPLTHAERANIDAIAMVIMMKCKLPETFDHVGPENSEEEDQFYRYRKELADIFKSLLAVQSTMEPLLDFMIKTIEGVCTALQSTQAEVVEVLLFLLYHFAECVPELHKIIAGDNKFSALLAFLFRSELKTHPHKIVIKQYLEVCIRYAGYFESPNRTGDLPHVIDPLVKHISSADASVSKHAVYMLYRLVLKIPRGIISQAHVLLSHIQQCLSRPIDDQSSMHLYKTFGLLMGNRSIGIETQKSFFQAYIGTLAGTIGFAEISKIAELVGGFQRLAPVELHQELIQIASYVLQQLRSQAISQPLYESTVYFCQKLLVSLEDAASEFLSETLQTLLTATSLETIDELMKVRCRQLVTHTAVSVKKRLDVALPPAVLSSLVSGVIATVPRPESLTSAVCQQAATIRRTWLKLLEVLESKGADLLALADPEALVLYVSGIADNTAEGAVVHMQSIKSAITVLSHVLIKRPQRSPVTDLCLERLFEVTGLLLRAGMNPRTAEATMILQGVAEAHREALIFCRKVGSENECAAALQAVIPAPVFNSYCQVLGEFSADSPEAKKQHAEKLAQLRTLLVGIVAASR